MPELANPFPGMATDKRLTPEEVVAFEFEAVQIYMQLAKSIDNELVQEVLKDISDEERVKVVWKPCESRDEGNGEANLLDTPPSFSYPLNRILFV